MFGAKTEHGVVAFAVYYGFFARCCMATPMLAVLAKSVDVVGIRIEFAFSFALLTGNPISGVLLHQHEYLWSYAIVFNAVCTSIPVVLEVRCRTLFRVMVLWGCFLLIVSRAMVAKAKGAQWI
ncbi:hypothetical protein BD309DRAFT_863344 [Dichomitus squalens]|uniref:Uncharacterized protein n=1 Tax=Dichomitus squalens TaxID=114155 RepID=A0A4Q9PI88_9APHY|nr:hypothetical protein BD309DRAFT_863344 [Dichomitus squalens]TBU53712.1 hypothetical protein BD310DRAFT_829512 [Dichomitus squalens]